MLKKVAKKKDLLVYLTADRNGLTAGDRSGKTYGRFKTEAGYLRCMGQIARKLKVSVNDLEISCSSSLDNPEQFTMNKGIIETCRSIRCVFSPSFTTSTWTATTAPLTIPKWTIINKTSKRK